MPLEKNRGMGTCRAPWTGYAATRVARCTEVNLDLSRGPERTEGISTSRHRPTPAPYEVPWASRERSSKAAVGSSALRK